MWITSQGFYGKIYIELLWTLNNTKMKTKQREKMIIDTKKHENRYEIRNHTKRFSRVFVWIKNFCVV